MGEYILSPLHVESGKYTLHYKQGEGFHADRYGESWRDLTGDGMVLAMAMEIESLRAAIQKIWDAHGDKQSLDPAIFEARELLPKQEAA